jgi:hypothetical protein
MGLADFTGFRDYFYAEIMNCDTRRLGESCHGHQKALQWLALLNAKFREMKDGNCAEDWALIAVTFVNCWRCCGPVSIIYACWMGISGGFPIDRCGISLQIRTRATGTQGEMNTVWSWYRCMTLAIQLGSFNHPDVAAAIPAVCERGIGTGFVSTHGYFQGYYFHYSEWTARRVSNSEIIRI